VHPHQGWVGLFSISKYTPPYSTSAVSNTKPDLKHIQVNCESESCGFQWTWGICSARCRPGIGECARRQLNSGYFYPGYDLADGILALTFYPSEPNLVRLELQGLMPPVIDPFLLAQSSPVRVSSASAPDVDASPGSLEMPTPITGNTNSMTLSVSRRRVSANNPSFGYVEGVMRGHEKFGKLHALLTDTL
jgi:hypothetical protein